MFVLGVCAKNHQLKLRWILLNKQWRKDFNVKMRIMFPAYRRKTSFFCLLTAFGRSRCLCQQFSSCISRSFCLVQKKYCGEFQCIHFVLSFIIDYCIFTFSEEMIKYFFSKSLWYTGFIINWAFFISWKEENYMLLFRISKIDYID